MTNKQKIEKILTEYPSHPPIKGSEYGLNLVTVDKLDALITQNCKQAVEDVIKMCEKSKRGKVDGEDELWAAHYLGHDEALTNLIHSLEKMIEKECNCYSNIQKVGRAHYVCTKCERDLSLDVVFAHRAGIDLLKNKKHATQPTTKR